MKKPEKKENTWIALPELGKTKSSAAYNLAIDDYEKFLEGFDIDDAVDSYEVRGDDGDYSPNEQERFIMKDFLLGVFDELLGR